MKAKRILSKVVGAIQSGLGASCLILAFGLYHDLFGIQDTLNANAENSPFYVLLLVTLGVFSATSSFFLLRE